MKKRINQKPKRFNAMTSMHRIILSVFTWSFLPFSINQSSAQGNTIVKDFNNDKSFDFLVTGMKWLDVDSWEYVLTDGRTGKRWAYASTLYYVGPESFISTSKTRNELPDGWDNAIKLCEDTLIHFKTSPDPSLEWALNARVVDDKSNDQKLYDRAVSFKKVWYTGIPFIPEDYTYRFGEEASQYFESFDPFETYYFVYRSHNHKDKPENLNREDIPVKRNGILRTKHALLEVKDGKYAWIFISGFLPTDGPSKLRWASMEKIQQQDELIFLQQQVVVGEYNFWVGNMDMNVWIRISNENFDDRADFKLENGNLKLLDREGDVNITIPIDDLRRNILSLKL